MKFIIIAIFLLGARSCNEKRTQVFNRSTELNSFLAAYGKDTLANDKKYVFIYHNVECNSCFTGLFDSVNHIFANIPANKIFIFTKHDLSLVNRVNTIKNSSIIFDNKKMLSELGLSFGTDLLVKYENGVPVDYVEITNSNLTRLTELAK